MQKQNINNNSGNAAISEITNSSIGNNNKDKHSNQYRRINYMIFKCDTYHTIYQIKHVCVCIYKMNYLCIYEWCYGSIKCK